MKCDHEFDAACLRCCQNKIVEVVALTERATAAGEKHAKEVERLRAENAALKTEARTRDAEHASLLEAQIKRLEREYQEAQNGFNDHVALCKQLQAENAELRGSCDLDNFLELKWFRRHEQLVREIIEADEGYPEQDAVHALSKWLEANPKPGAGT